MDDEDEEEDEDDVVHNKSEENKDHVEEEKKGLRENHSYMRTGIITRDEYHRYCDQALECTPIFK